MAITCNRCGEKYPTVIQAIHCKCVHEQPALSVNKLIALFHDSLLTALEGEDLYEIVVVVGLRRVGDDDVRTFHILNPATHGRSAFGSALQTMISMGFEKSMDHSTDVLATLHDND